ncbi:MAG: proton-conducting membrane transporter [Oscillospiraceae bacterium]|nr:proton-conducting membrane transporter [Oscillospiraceae bacterium]
MYHYLLFLAVLIPVLAGILTVFIKSRRTRNVLLAEALGATLICAVAAALTGNGLAGVADMGPFAFRFGGDRLGQLFSVLFSLLFLLSGIFSLEYNEHDEKQGRFNCFYLLTLGAMMGLSYAQNLFTYYFFYECMTLLSMPLVFHDGTKESMKAALKYLGYSLFGAALVLFGFFFAGQYCDTTDFIEGGTFNALGQSNLGIALVAAFCLFLGFGCKAGMLPLHHWLPTAHPVAPAPASAVLSATITKVGVLGIIRSAYYVFGADTLRGTWVQTAMLVLALATVFMGSMLAYKEKLLKRRLAWSTVSQVSYALFGIFLFSSVGLTGALMQVVFHALSKTALFLSAGAIIHQTGKTKVAELTGVGKKMPLVFFSFAFAALSLVGIPPFAGFVSKWSLATGAMESVGPLGVAGAAVLLLSALLTAGYLFPIVIHGCLDEGGFDRPLEPGRKMTVPLLLLAVLLLLLGLFTGPLAAVLPAMTGIL